MSGNHKSVRAKHLKDRRVKSPIKQLFIVVNKEFPYVCCFCFVVAVNTFILPSTLPHSKLTLDETIQIFTFCVSQ